MSAITLAEAALALPIVREQIAHERACLRTHDDVIQYERSVRRCGEEIERLRHGRQSHLDRLERLIAREAELIAVVVGD